MNFKNIMKYIKWGKHDKKTYNMFSEEITKENTKRIGLLCLFQFLFNLILLICTHFIDNRFFTKGYNIYTLGIIINIVIFIAIKYLPKPREKHVTIVAYIFILLTLITSEFLGTYLNSDTIIVSIIGLYILFPIVFSDNPLRYSLITITFTIWLCYDTLTIKNIDYAIVDCINSLIFCFAGCIVQYYMNNERIDKLILFEEISKKNKVDYLTKLSNRLDTECGINDYLKENNTKNVMFVLDLDNFKEVNDSYGHINGDKILIEVSKALKKVFRGSDYIARIGGDEFVVFSSNINDDNIAKMKAKKIIEEIKKITVNNDQVIGCSVGIAFSVENDNYDKLFIRADEAMYEAKNNGKNCYREYKK